MMVWLQNRCKNLGALLLALAFGLASNGQNFIETGNFTNNCGWDYFSRGGCNTSFFGPSAGNSFIWTTQPLAAGNCYFRLFTDWGGNQQRHEPNTTTQLNPNTEYALNSNWGTANANFINAGNAAWNYVFKTPNGDGINNTPQVIIFEVQGAIRTIASVSQTPASVNPGQATILTADVSGTGPLPTGQGIYLRYTDNGFATSTVVEMTYTGTGQTYQATIPGGINASGANITYYLFTSGAALTIPGTKADWYTINLLNNAGANYNYTVTNVWTTRPSGSGLWSDPLSWDPGSIPPIGVPVWIEDPLLLDTDAEIANITILPSINFTSDDGNGRTLRIQPGGSLSNNGTLTAPGGRIHFMGNATATGTLPFHTVWIAGGVDFGPAATVSDTLKILPSGFVNTNPPALLPASTLNYATGSTMGAPYGRFLEWNAPYNVAITDNTWLDWPNGANLTPQTIAGNLHVVSGGVHWRDSERPLNVAGEVRVENGGALEMSTLVGGDLYVAGDFINNGTFNGNNRTVKFNGSTLQTLTGNFVGANRFHYLDIDNPAGITPFTDIEVEDTLRFYNGLIYLNINHLTFTETGVTSSVASFAPRSASMIVTQGSGEVRKIYTAPSAFTFPVGDASSTQEYSPCTIEFTAGAFAPGAFLGVRLTDLKHPLNPSINHYLTRFWEVEESGITNFTYNGHFNYVDADVVGTEANIIGLKSDDGGLTWQNLPTVNALSNEVFEYGLTNFSIFTGGENSLLAVDWAYFTGYKVGDHVELEWATTQEWNADYFVVERSGDGNQYTDQFQQPAMGTSTSPNIYQQDDHNPLQGWNWYRLRQVDRNGNTSWSNSVQVYFGDETSIQPNDFIPYAHHGHIYAQITSNGNEHWTVEAHDLQGRLIAQTEILTQPGQVQYSIGPAAFGYGNILLITARTGNAILHQKVLMH